MTCGFSVRTGQRGYPAFLDAEEVRGSNPLAPTVRTAGKTLLRGRGSSSGSPACHVRATDLGDRGRQRSCCWLSSLLRYRDRRGDDWAGTIDFLTMWPDAGRPVCAYLGRSVERSHRRVPSRPEQIHDGNPPSAVLVTRVSNTLPREVQADADGEVRLVARTRLSASRKRGWGHERSDS